jgi:hypothetical protein
MYYLPARCGDPKHACIAFPHAAATQNMHVLPSRTVRRPKTCMFLPSGSVRTAFILALIAVALDFLPLPGIIGDWIESLLTIIAYIMTLVGWNKIKNAAV